MLRISLRILLSLTLVLSFPPDGAAARHPLPISPGAENSDVFHNQALAGAAAASLHAFSSAGHLIRKRTHRLRPVVAAGLGLYRWLLLVMDQGRWKAMRNALQHGYNDTPSENVDPHLFKWLKQASQEDQREQEPVWSTLVQFAVGMKYAPKSRRASVRMLPESHRAALQAWWNRDPAARILFERIFFDWPTNNPFRVPGDSSWMEQSNSVGGPAHYVRGIGTSAEHVIETRVDLLGESESTDIARAILQQVRNAIDQTPSGWQRDNWGAWTTGSEAICQVLYKPAQAPRVIQSSIRPLEWKSALDFVRVDIPTPAALKTLNTTGAPMPYWHSTGDHDYKNYGGVIRNAVLIEMLDAIQRPYKTRLSPSLNGVKNQILPPTIRAEKLHPIVEHYARAIGDIFDRFEGWDLQEKASLVFTPAHGLLLVLAPAASQVENFPNLIPVSLTKQAIRVTLGPEALKELNFSPDQTLIVYQLALPSHGTPSRSRAQTPTNPKTFKSIVKEFFSKKTASWPIVVAVGIVTLIAFAVVGVLLMKYTTPLKNHGMIFDVIRYASLSFFFGIPGGREPTPEQSVPLFMPGQEIGWQRLIGVIYKVSQAYATPFLGVLWRGPRSQLDWFPIERWRELTLRKDFVVVEQIVGNLLGRKLAPQWIERSPGNGKGAIAQAMDKFLKRLMDEAKAEPALHDLLTHRLLELMQIDALARVVKLPYPSYKKPPTNGDLSIYQDHRGVMPGKIHSVAIPTWLEAAMMRMPAGSRIIVFGSFAEWMLSNARFTSRFQSGQFPHDFDFWIPQGPMVDEEAIGKILGNSAPKELPIRTLKHSAEGRYLLTKNPIESGRLGIELTAIRPGQMDVTVSAPTTAGVLRAVWDRTITLIPETPLHPFDVFQALLLERRGYRLPRAVQSALVHALHTTALSDWTPFDFARLAKLLKEDGRQGPIEKILAAAGLALSSEGQIREIPGAQRAMAFAA